MSLHLVTNLLQDDDVSGLQAAARMTSGCGRFQPSYKRVGLEIIAEWKKYRLRRFDASYWAISTDGPPSFASRSPAR